MIFVIALTSIAGVIIWIPRFDPCRFFLQSRIYVNRPKTLRELKVNIREEISHTTSAILVSIKINTRLRLPQYTGNGRRHLPDLIFSKLKSNLLECTATL